MWASCCEKQHIDTFRCVVIHVFDYLGSLYEKCYECRTIGCNHSVISAFLDHVDKKHMWNIKPITYVIQNHMWKSRASTDVNVFKGHSARSALEAATRDVL